MNPGDVAQIIDEADPWYPCLVLLTRTRGTKLMGCVVVPGSNDGTERVGQAFRFFRPQSIQVIGKAVVVPGVPGTV